MRKGKEMLSMMPCCPVGEASGDCQPNFSRHCWLFLVPSSHWPRLGLQLPVQVCLRMRIWMLPAMLLRTSAEVTKVP